MDFRVTADLERGQVITVLVDGSPVAAHRGETVAGLLVATGRRVLRSTLRTHAPRGVFCGMGVCYDCLVTVNGVPFVRACMTPVAEGMDIETAPR